MDAAPTWLCSRGHIATAKEFAEIGVTRERLYASVARGRIVRAARGVYSCAHLDEQVLSAVGAGCLIDCVTALSRHAHLWSGRSDSAAQHWRARDGWHHRANPMAATVHWRTQFGERVHPGEVAPVDALLQVMHCLEPYDALACIESALHLGYLDENGLAQLLELAPLWMRPTLARLDRGSQSGFETHTRLPLEDAGHTVETQVEIPGAGPLDLLVDGCVGVETDGKKWHAERFIRDRTKDIRVEGWGIRVLRIGAPHIFETWPETLATIEQMIRDAPRRS